MAALNKNKVIVDAARMDALAIGETLRVSFNELASKLLYYPVFLFPLRRRFPSLSLVSLFFLSLYLHIMRNVSFPFCSGWLWDSKGAN